MNTQKNFSKVIEDKFSDFEKSQLRLIKQLTISDILNNISPYRLITHDTEIVAKIVDQSLNKILDMRQRFFLNCLISPSVTLPDIAKILSAQAQTDATLTEEKAKIINKLTLEFMQTFCRPDGSINWGKLVKWNSGNFDLDKVFSP